MRHDARDRFAASPCERGGAGAIAEGHGNGPVKVADQLAKGNARLAGNTRARDRKREAG
ncbi:hypothetical protein GCM10007898_36570 [Dyella flagellata]|uniref:Uncharacterized protein n=1 Tax=Dyella flagellata TaxID=1867833 RepID=A0ABQ5XEX4_9GAMM|nr:hypothetical protein GCM10007898_36570 [Dyella flagellata]